MMICVKSSLTSMVDDECNTFFVCDYNSRYVEHYNGNMLLLFSSFLTCTVMTFINE